MQYQNNLERNSRKQKYWDYRDLFAIAPLAALICALFRLHVFGETLYLGNPDRLNNNLKVTKFHVDQLVSSGSIQAWNDHELLGFDTFALPYTFPNPVTFFASWVGSDHLYVFAGYISPLLLFLSGVAAYAFIREIVRDRTASFVGAATYQLSTIAVLKVSQNDMSFIVFVLFPLLLLAIRRVSWRNAAPQAVLIGLLCFALLQFAFLQKAAYALICAASYVIVLSLSRKSLAPVVAGGIGALSAAVAAAPRFYGLFEAMGQYTRFGATAPYASMPIELLRWFDPFLFGASFTEAQASGSTLNLSEGFLLYVGALAPLLLGYALWRSATSGDRGHGASRAEWIFLWAMLVIPLLVVTYRPALMVVYWTFMKVDFIHGRILIVALLPACVFIAWSLHLIRKLASEGHGVTILHRLLPGLLVGVGLVAFLETLAHSNIGHVFRLTFVEWPIQDASAIRVAGSIVCFGVLVLTILRAPARLSESAWFTLCTFMVVQMFSTANLQINGSHATESPIPFQNGDVYHAARNAFHMPSDSDIHALADRLQTDQYRSVLICDGSIAGGFCAAHVAEYWKLRVADGYYGFGIPARLATLPLKSALGLRQLIFTSDQDLPWATLGLMNVKYVVKVSPGMYGYSIGESRAPSTVLENHERVTPRAFFAAEVNQVASAAEAASRIFSSDLVVDVEQISMSEGLPNRMSSLSQGQAQISGTGDKLKVRFEPASSARFLVINELFMPRWIARIDGQDARIYPTNIFMRGVIVPPGVREITFEYKPFVRTRLAWLLRIAGGLLLLAGVASLLIASNRRLRAT